MNKWIFVLMLMLAGVTLPFCSTEHKIIVKCQISEDPQKNEALCEKVVNFAEKQFRNNNNSGS